MHNTVMEPKEESLEKPHTPSPSPGYPQDVPMEIVFVDETDDSNAARPPPADPPAPGSKTSADKPGTPKGAGDA